MSIDTTKHRDRIPDEEATLWPRWLTLATSSAPRWFKGKELDLLTPSERYELYRETSSSGKPAMVVPMIMLSVSLPNMIRSFHSLVAPIWLLIGFLAVWAGVWFLRRRSTLYKARNKVRDRGDWPLLLQRRGLLDHRSN